jgi:hypothetical protein
VPGTACPLQLPSPAWLASGWVGQEVMPGGTACPLQLPWPALASFQPLWAGLGKRLGRAIILSVTFLPGEALSKQHNTKSALLQEGYVSVDQPCYSSTPLS